MTTTQISMHNANATIILAVNDYDAAAGLITPSAPRARNTSDISEGDAANAAAAAANLTFASIVQMYPYPSTQSTQSTPFQASPAMLLSDGMYMYDAVSRSST
jgi:hypothetical protein